MRHPLLSIALLAILLGSQPSSGADESSRPKPGTTSPAEADQESLKLEHVGLERVERNRTKKLEEIEAESLCETVHKLIFEEQYPASFQLDDFSNSNLILQAVRNEARYRRLITFTGPEWKAERAEIVACLETELETFITKLPLCSPVGELPIVGSSVHTTRGASVAALLLAELAEEGRHLPVVARAHVRSQEASLHAYRSSDLVIDPNVDYIASVDGAVYARAEEILIAKIAASVAEHRSKFDFPTTDVLREFRAFQESASAEIVDGEGRPIDRIAMLNRQPKLYRIAILSLEYNE